MFWWVSYWILQKFSHFRLQGFFLKIEDPKSFFSTQTQSKPFWLVLNFFAMWYVMIDERTSHTIVVQRFLLTQQEFSRPWVKKYPDACFQAALQSPLSLEIFFTNFPFWMVLWAPCRLALNLKRCTQKDKDSLGCWYS